MQIGLANLAFHSYRPVGMVGGTTTIETHDDGRRYKVHEFTSSGNILSSTSSENTSIDYLIVGGGGRGGDTLNISSQYFNGGGQCATTSFYTCCGPYDCYTCSFCSSYRSALTSTVHGGGGSAGEVKTGTYQITHGSAYSLTVGVGATATDGSYTMPTNIPSSPGESPVMTITNVKSYSNATASSAFGITATAGNNGTGGSNGSGGTGAVSPVTGDGGGVGSGPFSYRMPGGGGAGAGSGISGDTSYIGEPHNGGNYAAVQNGRGGFGRYVWDRYYASGGNGGGSSSGSYTRWHRLGGGANSTSGGTIQDQSGGWGSFSTAAAKSNSFGRGGGGGGGGIKEIGTAQFYSLLLAGGNGGNGVIRVRYPIEPEAARLNRTNFILDPGFEGTEGYRYGGTKDTSVKYSGTASLRQTLAVNSTQLFAGSLITHQVDRVLVPHSLSFRIIGNQTGTLRFTFTIGTTSSIVDVGITTSWQYIKIENVIPEASTTYAISAKNIGADSLTFNIDEMLLEEGATAGTYFDGSSPGGRWISNYTVDYVDGPNGVYDATGSENNSRSIGTFLIP